MIKLSLPFADLALGRFTISPPFQSMNSMAYATLKKSISDWLNGQSQTQSMQKRFKTGEPRITLLREHSVQALAVQIGFAGELADATRFCNIS